MNRERVLEQALRFATAYVQKAVADGLMEDCAVPASVALERLRAVLDGGEATAATTTDQLEEIAGDIGGIVAYVNGHPTIVAEDYSYYTDEDL